MLSGPRRIAAISFICCSLLLVLLCRRGKSLIKLLRNRNDDRSGADIASHHSESENGGASTDLVAASASPATGPVQANIVEEKEDASEAKQSDKAQVHADVGDCTADELAVASRAKQLRDLETVAYALLDVFRRQVSEVMTDAAKKFQAEVRYVLFACSLISVFRGS